MFISLNNKKKFLFLLSLNKGGSAQRKLTVLPPEAEGYSVKVLRAVSEGGKATFYIVALQETLDTSPLPPDSQHFSKMPKKTCYQCNDTLRHAQENCPLIKLIMR